MTDKPSRARTRAIRDYMAANPGTSYTAAARIVDNQHTADPDTYIKTVVDAAPPLTGDQKHQLATLLSPFGAPAPKPTPAVTYGPKQILTYVQLTEWEFHRGRELGHIPDPDVDGRWSQTAADAIRESRPTWHDLLGTLPDVGAWRAAEYWSAQFHTHVTPDAIHEAARRGIVGYAGDFKGNQLFSGQDLQAFDNPDLLVDLVTMGERRTRDRAAEYLGVRTSAIDALTDAGWLIASTLGRGPFDRRSRRSVPLYRTGDLHQLRTDPLIDWPAVRATPKGRRSPLRALPALDLDVLLDRERRLTPGLVVEVTAAMAVHLHQITVPEPLRGQRIGEGVLRRLLAWADHRDLPVTAAPTAAAPTPADSYSAGNTDWLHRHGFERTDLPGWGMLRPAWSQIPDWRRENISYQTW